MFLLAFTFQFHRVLKWTYSGNSMGYSGHVAKRATKALANSALAIASASFASVVGTLMHQTQVGDEIPIGLLFSLSLVLLIAGGIRDKQSGKIPGLVFTITLAAQLFLIAQNLSGDILIPANNAGLWWSYGAIGVAALVALWPKLKS